MSDLFTHNIVKKACQNRYLPGPRNHKLHTLLHFHAYESKYLHAPTSKE